MIYNFNNKDIRIPDSEIKNSMKNLDIDFNTAIQLWLEDNEYLENATITELTEKAKINKIGHDAKASKPRKVVERVRKPDVEKENLIKLFANALKSQNIDYKIVNNSKIIEFSINENKYKLDLIKQRAKK